MNAMSVVCRGVTVTCLLLEHGPDDPDESEHAE
jgi:hypothetical protein